MGRVDKVLAKVELPDRDDHNARVFVDLSENIHLHYREHRIVFRVDEFLCVAKAFTDAAETLKKRVNDGYVCGAVEDGEDDNGHETEFIGGSNKDLMNMKDSHKSYFNNRMVIERQHESVRDRIHIHYRDYRLVMDNPETFDKFCECVTEARENLDKW
jgi:hypothetical protein|tara:strand:+ start:301 stop:774 length:474 start_codon:yes stop_codon:yes gene_type:complete